jgi:hypothetical protein
MGKYIVIYISENSESRESESNEPERQQQNDCGGLYSDNYLSLGFLLCVNVTYPIPEKNLRAMQCF